MASIKVVNLAKAFGIEELFNKVNFEVERMDAVIILGNLFFICRSIVYN